MRTAYFHEDDYCQIELVCDENLAWCLDQTRRIADFADEHRGDDIFVRPVHAVELAARAISVAALTSAIAPPLQRYDAVTSGYASVEEPVANTSAFGASGLTLFASYPEGVVSAIWFALEPGDEASVASALTTFSALSRWRLLLVDWGWGRVMPLNDGAAIEAYLRERVRVFRELSEKFERDRRQQSSWLGRIRQWFH